jgi:hypothetical protein
MIYVILGWTAFLSMLAIAPDVTLWTYCILCWIFMGVFTWNDMQRADTGSSSLTLSEIALQVLMAPVTVGMGLVWISSVILSRR